MAIPAVRKTVRSGSHDPEEAGSHASSAHETGLPFIVDRREFDRLKCSYRIDGPQPPFKSQVASG